jgi:hypothetical protein
MVSYCESSSMGEFLSRASALHTALHTRLATHGLLRSIRVAAPLVFAASVALVPSNAQAFYVFADPSGFSSQSSAQSLYNFLGTGDLSISVPFRGTGISFNQVALDFAATGVSNPSWMGAVRQMFVLAYAGSASGGPKELAQLELGFASPLSPASYLVFADFDSYEGLAIAAFDPSGSLIPYANFALTRLDGEEPGGASLTMPNWTNTNPTQGWATADNTGWVGTNAVSGFLQDTTNISTNDVAVALQANTGISRLVFYLNSESISGTGSNSIRFNVASPPPTPAVPGPLSIFGSFAAFAYSRRLRRRIRRHSHGSTLPVLIRP